MTIEELEIAMDDIGVALADEGMSADEIESLLVRESQRVAQEIRDES